MLLTVDTNLGRVLSRLLSRIQIILTLPKSAVVHRMQKTQLRL